MNLLDKMIELAKMALPEKVNTDDEKQMAAYTLYHYLRQIKSGEMSIIDKVN